MVLISRQKKSSNFLNPYLSKPRNVNVSAIVIKTPPHNGIFLSDKIYRANAVFEDKNKMQWNWTFTKNYLQWKDNKS